MRLVKPHRGQAVRASSVPVEESSPQRPSSGIRATSLPPELQCPADLNRRSSTASADSRKSSSSHHSSSSSVSLPPQHKEPRLGTLVAVVLRARHLPDRHVCSKQNVYTRITFCGEILRTKVDIRGGQTPQWDEELRFGVWSETADAMNIPPSPTEGGFKVADAKLMKISIWEDTKGPDLLVGEGLLDVSQALHKGEFDEWIPLSRDGTQRGEVFLELTYFSAGLPHIPSRPFSVDFKSYVVPEDIAKNMSYIVPPTHSMIAVASVAERGTPLPPPRSGTFPRTSSAADGHRHVQSISGPTLTKLLKPRPASLQMDGLPSTTFVSFSSAQVSGMPNGFCNSPLDSPTPTQTKPAIPTHDSESAEDGALSSESSSEFAASNMNTSPEPPFKERWTDKMSSLIHNVAGKLHIQQEHSEPQPESRSESPSPSVESNSTTESDTEDDIRVPGGF
ncbi:hypothetical protein GYMLUDRAFT_40775 [Collybiopsis luxurians FD-317 M1]|uniref:C2 domain-containing protein n=1 Tax=Collybiopsis luxurians FD-317 M1 TaxID=944289 RepID=A0A0D0CL69_9AGAR|nr:hypothetical protein GYMLUDRAFT_40775 [Collybiopsis luxurians FD-317 M1]